MIQTLSTFLAALLSFLNRELFLPMRFVLCVDCKPLWFLLFAR